MLEEKEIEYNIKYTIGKVKYLQSEEGTSELMKILRNYKELQDKLDKIKEYNIEQKEYAMTNKEISDDEHNTIMTLTNDNLSIIGDDK